MNGCMTIMSHTKGLVDGISGGLVGFLLAKPECWLNQGIIYTGLACPLDKRMGFLLENYGVLRGCQTAVAKKYGLFGF